MTVVIIIDNQRSEPLENNDSGDYNKHHCHGFLMVQTVDCL